MLQFPKNSRIKLFKTPKNSGGPANSKNIGIENAKGEYIAFLDHDDEWLPKKLEKQLKVFETSENKKLALVACFLNIIDNENNKVVSIHKNFNKKRALKMLVQYNFFVTSSCIMVKKSILKEVGEFDKNFKVSDDWDMWLRIIKSGYEFDVVPECLVNYFVHKNNLSSNSNIDKQFEEFKLLSAKNKEGPFKMKESWFFGYYYFVKKQYKLSRQYSMENLFSKDLSLLVRLKSLAYILLTFFPKQEEKFRKIWRKIKR